MKVGIEQITSVGIRTEMEKDHYTTADFLGEYQHPEHDGNDWCVRLYRAADALVFETNGDPVWQENPAFDQLAEEYRVFGDLRDYQTGAKIRSAMVTEWRDSRKSEANNIGSGTGVIVVDGKSCYVDGGPEL